MLEPIRDRFFKSTVFKGLLSSYVQRPDALAVSKAVVGDQIKEAKEATVATLPDLVKGELTKIETMQKNEAMRFRVPMNMNSWSNPDRKLGSDVPFSYLRRMSVIYPIARACINRRIRQITQLSWDVTTIDGIEGENGYDNEIAEVKLFLKQPFGHNSRMRKMITMLIDDILTLDAVSYEIAKTRGGTFRHLIPVDPTTMALKVDESGATPEPPEEAYVQYIGGHKTAGFTTDDMIYDMMNPRSNTPYGISPLESLIIQVESAVRGAMYNLSYLKENNIPEGFLTLPSDIASNKNQVEDWQMWFDAILAGDSRTIHRLKVIPNGSEYTPAKKPEDMAFEKFELWLLQQTCAMFDIPPQDIGITYQVNKSTSESQANLSRERGLIPLGNFVKEIFDHIIQDVMGHVDLQFIWTNINPIDRKEEADIAKTEMDMGASSVDQYLIAKGEEPIGLGHYIQTKEGPMLVERFLKREKELMSLNAADQAKAATEAKVNAPDAKKDGESDPAKKAEISEEDEDRLELEDLRKWRKCVYRDIEDGKELRLKFASEHIKQKVHEAIEKRLISVHSKEQAKLVFDEYLDSKLRASLTLLDHAKELRKIEHEYTDTSTS